MIEKRLYADIERHAMDPRSLDFLFERIDGSEWTYGRFIFYAAVNPPDNVLADLLPRMEDSLRAMQYGMHVMAKDLDDRKEYNNYKHALRVVDSFKKLFLWDRIKSQLLEVDTGVSYSYPKFDRKNRVYNITSVPLDFERDYNMCVLASVFVQMMRNEQKGGA
ncbi:MAG: hypothetical protein IPJ85_05540 [Flavobacteriales bacterium]|nr:hypothetical protein [Flavobacteriales bacterium]